MTTARLPPGSTGLPLLGETLTFLRNPYGFISERTAKHGPVFRTSLFGARTAVIVGGEAAIRFIDPALIERAGSQPAPVFRLFAGPSVPHLDGPPFLDRKQILLQAFTRDALASYLPATQALVERALARLTSKAEVRLVPELKELALEAVAQDIMGIVDAGSLERLHGWYRALDLAFTGLPVALPGTNYAKGLQAVASITAFFEEVVRAHRAKPTRDGLSRILAFRTPSGATLTDNQAARELHHLMLAGRVVYAHLVGMVLQLAKRPELQAALRDEIRTVAPGRALTVEQLLAMRLLSRVLMEVKRVAPVVPGMFGKAKTDIALGGYTIPRGWRVMFGLRQGHLDGSVFAHPETFDPDRFGEPRREDQKHPHAFVPHGPGAPPTSHHCAGTDYATQLAKLFTISLLRDYRFELPPQNLEYDWGRLTPDPKDEVRARILKQQ